jgi:predicted HTH domain antitoxin
MQAATVLELRLPADIAATIKAYGRERATDEERLRVPLAIGLFAERAVSLAKAARLAGLTRYEFAKLLKQRGLPAYEYTEAEYQEDLAFLATTQE